jgi:PKD repeat protein
MSVRHPRSAASPTTRRRRLQVLVVGVLALALLGLPAAAQPIRHDRIVSGSVTSGTPHALDGRVLAFAQVGTQMVVGGTFTQIQPWNSQAVIDRPFLFAFNAATGVITSSFAPALDGWVESLEPAPDGQSVFVGGQFRTVNGQEALRIARLRISDGSLMTGFQAGTNGKVNDIALSGGRLFLGGVFGTVNGQARIALAAVHPDTGALDPDVDFEFANPNLNRRGLGNLAVRKIDLTPDGAQLVLIGNFGTIDGQRRHQVAILDVASRPAQLVDWHTERYRQDLCSNSFASYTNGMEVSPDGTYFAIGTTGAYRANTLCDTIARWNLGVTGSNLQPEWTDYSGGDTFWSVGASGAAVYAGGHNRWMNNPFAADRAGPGAVEREGLAALDPKNGVPFSWNPGRNLGVGVFDLYSRPDRLWVGSDTDRIARWAYRGRLAAFPTQGGVVVPAADPGPLPGDLFTVPGAALPTDARVLYRVNAGGPELPAIDALPNWSADNGTTNPLRNSGSNAASWSAVGSLHASVPGHVPAGLYSTERWDPPAAPEMRWAFPVQAGRQVQVRLYLANRCTCTEQPGQRVAHIEINGQRVLNAYDIVADVGHDVGTMKQFTATGNASGQVVVEFLHVTENPLINGIEIIDPSLPAPPAVSGAPERQTFDGQQVGPASPVAGSGINGAQARGAFMLSGRVYHFHVDGSLYARTYDGTTFGPAQQISLNGLTDAQFPIGNVTGVFYEHTKARLYYTTSANPSVLFYRYFTPESGIVGAQTFQAVGNLAGLTWNSVRGMHLANDGTLYFGHTDGNLRRIAFDRASGTPSGTIQVVSGPAAGDGRNWNVRDLFLYSPPGYRAPNLPPVARATVRCEDLTCRFGATGSHDPDGELLDWRWTFSDGSSAVGAGATRTFAAPGTYTGTLTVTDDRGGQSSMSIQTTVPWAVAEMTASCIDLTCTFDGSASSGHGGVASYAWNLGNGQTASGAVVEHTYAQPGSYTVQLTVTDTAGGQDVTSRRIRIGPTPSGIAFVGRSAETGNLTAYRLTVPPAVRGGDLLMLFVSLAKSGVDVQPTGLTGWTRRQTLVNGGLQTTVWTKVAETGDEGQPVNIELDERIKGDAALVAYTGTSVTDPIAVLAGANETVTRAQHTTPQVTTTADGHWLVSYWADRTSATTAWTPPAGETVRHEGYGPGGGRITALLTDGAASRPPGVAGGLTAVADSATNRATMWTIVLAPRGFEPPDAVPPAAQFTSNCTGLVCIFDGSESIEGSAPITSFAWTLGGGATATGASVEHVFPDAGTYPVTLTVTDADGQTSSVTEQVAVVPPVAARITVSCMDLACSFDASDSSGGSGPITGWAWSFGDGSTASQEVVQHTYAAAGSYTVALTVTNAAGDTDTDEVVVTVAAAPSGITHLGLSHSAATQRIHRLQVPSTVRGGDGLLLFATTNTGSSTIGAPQDLTGWQELQPGQVVVPSDMRVRVWQRVAATGDAGRTVTVELSEAAKTDILLLAYGGTHTSGPVGAFSAAAHSGASTTQYTTPAVTASTAGSVVLAYWAQKSSSTTGWTPPADHAVRHLAVGTGSGRLAVLAADRGPVAPGTYGGAVATADGASAKATLWSLVLRPR